jgi:hypothetical protein
MTLELGGICLFRAREILREPLIFGEPLQIEAVNFLALYSQARELMAGYSSDDQREILHWYDASLLRELNRADLADLVYQLEPEVEPS